MNTKHILLAAVAAVTIGGTALAVTTTKPMKMDADGNGAVSKSEALAAADAKFAKMDINGDGTLNAADREARIKVHFQALDTDKNGAVSEAEFVAGREARIDDRAEKRGERGHHKGGRHGGHRGGGGHHGGGPGMAMMADADKDQAVTKAEFRAAAEARFAKADTDKSGSLSASEADAARKAWHNMPRSASSADKPAASVAPAVPATAN